jgi:hypothetical protein
METKDKYDNFRDPDFLQGIIVPEDVAMYATFMRSIMRKQMEERKDSITMLCYAETYLEYASLPVEDMWIRFAVIFSIDRAFPDHEMFSDTFSRMITIPGNAEEGGAPPRVGLVRSENSLITKMEPFSARASLWFEENT